MADAPSMNDQSEIVDELVENHDCSEESATEAVEKWAAEVQSGDCHFADNLQEDVKYILEEEKYW